MATNVSIYVPNDGEKEMLKAILLQKGMTLGLYKTNVPSDGSMNVASLSELTTGGGRGYAPIPLTTNLIESAAAALKWFIYTNSTGKAEGDYSNAALAWAFNTYDVADVATVYGVFAYCQTLLFTGGVKQIKVGDVLYGATSHKTAIVTGVCVQSGAWGTDAAGYLDIMTPSGAFQGENIYLAGEIATVSVAAGGTGYAVGDIVTITQTGGAGAKVVVLTLGASNAIATCALVDGGHGYTTATGLPTTNIVSAGGADATLTIASLATATYAAIAADAVKKLMAVWPFSTGIPITANGQSITWAMAMALASGS